MSSYTNYEDVSNSYDLYRRAGNMDLLIGMTTQLTGKTLKEMSVLDAGCGTGNYALGFLEAGLGHITMMDGSEGMLKTARIKTTKYQSIAEYRLSKLPALPFPDENFDVVMFNQVVHHLVDATLDYCYVREALQEALRVLKKGGVVIVDTSSQNQITHSFWFYPLIEISETFKCRYPPVEFLEKVLQNGGHATVQSYVQLDRVLMDYSMYSDLEGPLDPSWRLADSGFSEANPEQIQAFCQKIINMKNQNTLDDYFAQCEQDRLKFGQTTTIFARK